LNGKDLGERRRRVERITTTYGNIGRLILSIGNFVVLKSQELEERVGTYTEIAESTEFTELKEGKPTTEKEGWWTEPAPQRPVY
jgi:hypothetical protein